MTIKAGFSKICINPPLGAPIAGYYMPRFSKGILDDIYVRAVAFDDGKKRAVIVTLDLCELTAEQFALYKKTFTVTGVSSYGHHIARFPFFNFVICDYITYPDLIQNLFTYSFSLALSLLYEFIINYPLLKKKYQGK